MLEVTAGGGVVVLEMTAGKGCGVEDDSWVGIVVLEVTAGGGVVVLEMTAGKGCGVGDDGEWRGCGVGDNGGGRLSC